MVFLTELILWKCRYSQGDWIHQLNCSNQTRSHIWIYMYIVRYVFIRSSEFSTYLIGGGVVVCYFYGVSLLSILYPFNLSYISSNVFVFVSLVIPDIYVYLYVCVYVCVCMCVPLFEEYTVILTGKSVNPYVNNHAIFTGFYAS